MEQTNEALEIWEKCLDIIKPNVKELTYNSWFKPIVPLKLDNKKLIIQVPNQFFYEWIETKFNQIVNKAIKTVIGEDATLTYQIKLSGSEDHRSPASHEQPVIVKQNRTVENNFNSNLNPKYTFDNFIIGDNNQLARAAANNIANNPGGTSFNPMVIYGSVGLGKTHLIQAIGNEVLKKYFDKKVIYTSSEKFTVDFVDSITNNKTSEFRNLYGSVDVLIVDDIQFFEGKEKTQDIFFHTFNALHQQNKQIILSCDRPPKDLKGITERLLSRFQWGLTADIQSPDLETRIAILNKKCESMNINLGDSGADIIEFIAMNITSNIRELEGALVGILAESSLTDKDISLDMVKDVIKRNASITARKNITIDLIQKVVSEYYNISESLLIDKTRKQEIALARQVAMYLSKELTKNPLKTIGLQFGGRDHTTVIHAHKCINDLKYSNEKFKNELDDIKRKIEMIF